MTLQEQLQKIRTFWGTYSIAYKVLDNGEEKAIMRGSLTAASKLAKEFSWRNDCDVIIRDESGKVLVKYTAEETRFLH